jgi:hypothetical protein
MCLSEFTHTHTHVDVRMMTCVRQCGVLRVFSTPPSFLPQKKKESVTERLLSPLPLFFLSFSSVEDFCVPAVFFLLVSSSARFFISTRAICKLGFCWKRGSLFPTSQHWQCSLPHGLSLNFLDTCFSVVNCFAMRKRGKRGERMRQECSHGFTINTRHCHY